MAHSKSRSGGQAYKQFREKMRLGSGFGYSPNIGDVTETSPQRTVQMILNMTQDAVSALIRNVIDETLNQQRDIVVAAQSFGDPANKDVQADIAQRVALYEVLQVRELIIKFPVGYLIPSDRLDAGCDFKWITVAAAKVLGYSCVTGYKDTDNFLVLRNVHEMATTMSAGCCCGCGGSSTPPGTPAPGNTPIVDDPGGQPTVSPGAGQTTKSYDDPACAAIIKQFAGTNSIKNLSLASLLRAIPIIGTLFSSGWPYQAFTSSGYDLYPEIDAAAKADSHYDPKCILKTVRFDYSYLAASQFGIGVGVDGRDGNNGNFDKTDWVLPVLQIFDKSNKFVRAIELIADSSFVTTPVDVEFPIEGVVVGVKYSETQVKADHHKVSIGGWDTVGGVKLVGVLLPTDYISTKFGSTTTPTLQFNLCGFSQVCNNSLVGDWTPKTTNFVAGATQAENVLWDDTGIGVRAKLAGPTGIALSNGVTDHNGYISITHDTIDYFYGFVYPSSSGFAKVEFTAGDLTAGNYTYVFKAQLQAQLNGINVGFGFLYANNVDFDVQETFNYTGFNGPPPPDPKIVEGAYKPFEVTGTFSYTDLTKKLAVFANGTLGYGGFRHLYISLKKVS